MEQIECVGVTGCCCAGARSDWPEAREELAEPPCHGRRSVPARAVRVPGGLIQVGTHAPLLPDDGEGPAREVRIKPFAIDPYAVTNEWFSEFVAATQYRTEAEASGWSFVFREFVPEWLRVQAVADAQWWIKVNGACWRQPEGPASSVADRLDHPVTHISWHDARAFARWAGGRLPTEAEWETAARGGLQHARYPWGDRDPDDTEFQPCNVWQGTFPEENIAADGFVGTAPVDTFEPNGFGLFNMVGNVWEWSSDPFRMRSLKKAARKRNLQAAAEGHFVLKGGSYLCHSSYCWRYRIAARTGNSPDSTAGHTGFRLAFDLTSKQMTD